MRITIKALKKLPVVTMSGQELGHIIDVVMDVAGQQVIQYEVKKGLKASFLISRDQVASIDENKFVVYDTAVPREERKKKESPIPPLADTVAATDIE